MTTTTISAHTVTSATTGLVYEIDFDPTIGSGWAAVRWTDADGIAQEVEGSAPDGYLLPIDVPEEDGAMLASTVARLAAGSPRETSIPSGDIVEATEEAEDAEEAEEVEEAEEAEEAGPLREPIRGRGWLLFTISSLALGLDPWAEEHNHISMDEVIAALEHARDLGLDLERHGMMFEVGYRIFQAGTATCWVYLAPIGAATPAFAYQWCEAIPARPDGGVWARRIQAPGVIAAAAPFAGAEPMDWSAWTTDEE